jgi:hypothetical protein
VGRRRVEIRGGLSSRQSLSRAAGAQDAMEKCNRWIRGYLNGLRNQDIWAMESLGRRRGWSVSGDGELGPGIERQGDRAVRGSLGARPNAKTRAR